MEAGWLAVGAGHRDPPHFWQNWATLLFWVPHWEQNTLSGIYGRTITRLPFRCKRKLLSPLIF